MQGWQLVATSNVVIAGCYLCIAWIILRGLVRTGQLRTNRLALATAAIFLSCAVHHGHHALHLLLPSGSTPSELASLRSVFGEWHSVLLDALGASIAVVYLGLRQSYGALLSTPAMFADAVQVATEERLRRLAFTDALTGCGNRAAYEAYVDTLAGTAVAVTLVFLDLDRFKAVNDRYGHAVGDRVLEQVGARLAGGLPPTARAFRLGGDEFAVIQVGPGAPDLSALCEQLIGAPLPLREGLLVISASAGTASAVATSDLVALLRDADMAMYDAKRRARAAEARQSELSAARDVPAPVLPVPRRQPAPADHPA